MRPEYLLNDEEWAAGKPNTRKKKEENQGDDSPPAMDAPNVTAASVDVRKRHIDQKKNVNLGEVKTCKCQIP